MTSLTVSIGNKLGLHARAAAKLVRLASQFTSDIWLGKEGASQQIDSKSILGILMLGAGQGTRLTFSISGSDENQAAQAIQRLFMEKFGEDG